VADKSHPYSKLYEKDGIVYVSGTASMDYSTFTPVKGRMEACERALDEVNQRLGTVGLNLTHVVKMIYFVTDITLRDEANEQFKQHFKEPRPARTVIGVAELPFGCTVAIDAIAHR
jgi:enamine deaminase RidA (YjgF/YER057c/UK114 family)